MQQKLKPSTSQPMHFQEVFRKCFHHVKENKGNIVKECGTDVMISFLIHVYAYLWKLV